MPHIAVDMSFEEYTSNQDPVLNAALAFTGSDFILDPMGHVTNLFLAGKMEKLVQDVSKMVNDKRYQFFDFETEFNKAGNKMLNGGQLEGAIGVFSLVTQVFPNSPNAWNSLAKGYLKAGAKDKAIEYYKKSFTLDADGSIGKNAKEMLEKIFYKNYQYDYINFSLKKSIVRCQANSAASLLYLGVVSL